MAPLLAKEKDIILFDGVCNFCNRYTNYVIQHDGTKRFLYASLQSDSAKELAQHFHTDFRNLNSIVVIHQDKLLTKSDAVIYIFKYLTTKWRYATALFRFIPKLIRDSLYDRFANSRYFLFGKSQHCLVPDARIRARFLP